MSKVSVILTTYNEVKFIERTLKSVLGEADEIIISDNASTDGTADICNDYASRYPEIKFTHHKINQGPTKNALFAIEQVTGNYIRYMGSHDMVSTGSTARMLNIMKQDQEIALVYSKYHIYLNSDYTYCKTTVIENWKGDLMSPSPYERVKTITEENKDVSLFHGLYKKDVYINALTTQNIFMPSIIPDHVIVTYAASQGKIAVDDSVFFRMNPRPVDKNLSSQMRRIAKTVTDGKSDNPYLWYFAVISEIYNLAQEMQKNSDAPENFSKLMLDIAIKRFAIVRNAKITMEGMPEIQPDKQELCKTVYSAIKQTEKKDIKNMLRLKLYKYLQNKLMSKGYLD